MIGMRAFYCIRVKACCLNRVIEVYEAFERKGFIEFSSAGIFSLSIDVVYENYFFAQELRKAGIPFSVRKMCSRYCLDSSELLHPQKEEDEVRKEILKVFCEILEEPDAKTPLTVSKTPLQIKEVAQKYVIEFSAKEGCTKDEFIKGIEERFNKLPDGTTFDSFRVFGIAAYGTRYEVVAEEEEKRAK